MISNYYLHKDACRYIQVKDILFRLNDTSNILSIPDLPVFNICMTRFNVRIGVSTDLKHVSLHIRALDPGDDALKGCMRVSLNPAHANFITKKISGVTIELSK